MNSTDGKGLLESLFDFSFSSFVTTKIIKIIYVILIIFAALATIGFIIGGISKGFFAAIGALIVSPLFFLLYVIMARIWLEVIIVIFRISEQLSSIDNSLKGSHDIE